MLANLPVELLSNIAVHLPTAQGVRNLSLTNCRLHDFVQKEGWKVFVRSHFPSTEPPPLWKDAAHSLTTISRNWDRRAFVARYLEPRAHLTQLPDREYIERWQRPRGQTMGFQPAVDSYDEWTGPGWADRKEILAWSAGTELLVRVKRMGQRADEIWHRCNNFEREEYFEDHHHFVEWFSYKSPGSFEGRDDITCVSIVRPQQRPPKPDLTEDILIGTASGDLTLLHVGLTQWSSFYRDVYATNGRPVRSTDISTSASPLLSACLSDSCIALYPLYSSPTTGQIAPIDELTATPKTGQVCRVWSTKFISDHRLAIGLGPSTEPVHVYELTPSGLSKDPVRKFSIDSIGWVTDDHVHAPKNRTDKSSSVYPIVPIPQSSQAASATGSTFLSGGYDGVIRLHDMRSPSSCQSTYWDPTDDSAIYSVQTLGRERLVAGGSRHSIVKIFDLRMAGGRIYHCTDINSSMTRSASNTNGSTDKASKKSSSHFKDSRFGWNVFLSPRNPNPRLRPASRRRSTESPVYSLSIPSPISPSLFIGVENNVVQFDFVSMLDKHPDPIYAAGLQWRPRTGDIDAKKTWNPRGEVLNLAMYEQGLEQGGVARLRVQAGIGRFEGTLQGVDERWRDGSDV